MSIDNNASLINELLFLADTNMILAQRNAEWCAHGPILEQDIAITNISLDTLGQARNFYQYAAELIGNDCNEDKLAYHRNERDFKNLLLVELPNNDWAHTIFRQFALSCYFEILYKKLAQTGNAQIAAIANKALKEIIYHIRWSGEWLIRLGDGTEESHLRTKNAINNFWPYIGEMFMPADYDTLLETQVYKNLQQDWLQKVTPVIEEATLEVPQNIFMQSGGKQGVHTENLGFILTDMQYLQRSYPGAEW